MTFVWVRRYAPVAMALLLAGCSSAATDQRSTPTTVHRPDAAAVAELNRKSAAAVEALIRARAQQARHEAEQRAAATTVVPTTSVEVAEGFQPACTESQRSGASTVALDESALATFGPLQSEPSMRITLPRGVSQNAPDPQTTSADPARVPGGLLVTVRASSYGYFPGSMLAVIDDDGVVRWVRCSSEDVTQVYVAPATTAPTMALVAVNVSRGTDRPLADYRLVSLADGSTTGTLADHLAAQGLDASANLSPWPLATTETKLLFGLPGDTIVDTSRDHLLLVDLVGLTAEQLPFPAFSNGTQMMYNGFEFDGSGDPYLVGWEDGKRIALRSYRDGVWSDEPSPVRGSSPVTIDFGLALAPFVGVGPDGAEVWRRDDIYSTGGEGFHMATAGDVTVVAGCRGTPTPENYCPEPMLAGLRTSNGATAWMLDGWRGVGAVGDGYAIVTDFDTSLPGADGGWIMIDTDTGRAVDGQQWSGADTFRQGCCGESEFVNVRMFGGILVTVNERSVAIYYPIGTTSGTQEVVLS